VAQDTGVGCHEQVADTYGASEGLPSYLDVTGEVSRPDFSLSVVIHTRKVTVEIAKRMAYFRVCVDHGE
jgi:hypothetical protein